MEKLIESLDVDDYSGDVAVLYGPQSPPFDIMEGLWRIHFDEDTGKWEAVEYEDEDDMCGTLMLHGYVNSLYDTERHSLFADTPVDPVVNSHEPPGECLPAAHCLHG
jgi:hypothetical protein